MKPPAEIPLRALASRFEQTEQNLRSLILRATRGGDRRELWVLALLELIERRRDALAASGELADFYRVAALALAGVTGREAPSSERVADLGLSLSLQLNRAVDVAERGSREAIASFTPADLEAGLAGAVAGDVDSRGRPVPLGDRAELLTRTLGRHAYARATPDVLGPNTYVEISGGSCNICKPLQGSASAALTPPFHPHCDCVASPVSVAPTRLYSAQMELLA
jgi:hypothetical protein